MLPRQVGSINPFPSPTRLSFLLPQPGDGSFSLQQKGSALTPTSPSPSPSSQALIRLPPEGQSAPCCLFPGPGHSLPYPDAGMSSSLDHLPLFLPCRPLPAQNLEPNLKTQLCSSYGFPSKPPPAHCCSWLMAWPQKWPPGLLFLVSPLPHQAPRTAHTPTKANLC